MGGGEGAGTARELDKTATWSVALVVATIIFISILLEKFLHLFKEWCEERHKSAILEALEKVKGELMVLGFISLLLTFSQNYINDVCIPLKYANKMLPCESPQVTNGYGGSGHEPPPTAKTEEHQRKLLWDDRRFLSASGGKSQCHEGQVPLISTNGLHQLHIFIFFLAVFHVIFSVITMLLGRTKTRGWKQWEREIVKEHQAMNDPSRFRLTHETSFVKGHKSFWNNVPVLFYIACFFRQFFRSVRKSDYATMRHGFVSVHLAPGSKFDFQKYIKRSLEDDFKVVVGISPLLWASVVLFLLANYNGSHVVFWVSVIPLLVILAVGTKLQAIITQMALEIEERHAVVQGIPLVQVSDKNFWFSWPPLVLHLIHFVLFQNAFEITYFLWIWYEFGSNSCFHESNGFLGIRVAIGVAVQFVCSYITLPLYALVTQMGSTMKRSVFDEQTSKALKQWHKKALIKKNEGKPEQPQVKKLGNSYSGNNKIVPTLDESNRSPQTKSQDAEFYDVELENTPNTQQHSDNKDVKDLLR